MAGPEMKTHKLVLLANSVSYFREAVKYAQSESEETEQWKFAIVHVVQAMELAFKEFLRRIHPTFIFESIDKPDKTVSMRMALARLRNPSIGNLPISDTEKAKIDKAFDLRNELTHFEFEFTHDHIQAKFAEIFSFMIFFYKESLGLSTEEFIGEDQLWQIMKAIRTRDELLQRAKAYVSRGEVGTAWICQECDEATFVLDEEQCCFCHHKEKIVSCDTCGSKAYESDLIDTTDLFDLDYDEGRTIVANDYGFEDSACPECIGDLKDQVREMRMSQYFEDMERDRM